jgi:hypothetical protein
MSANHVGSSHGKFGSDSYHAVAFLTLAPGSPAASTYGEIRLVNRCRCTKIQLCNTIAVRFANQSWVTAFEPKLVRLHLHDTES